MIQLFKKLLIILCLTILFVATLGVFFRAKMKIPLSELYFTYSKNIVIGSSMSECAFNDSILNNFDNFSRSGESYFYSYIKLRNIILNSENVQTVFIDFSNISISKRMDLWTWDDNHLSNSFSRYFCFFKSNEIIFLLTKNPIEFLKQYFLTLNQFYTNLLNSTKIEKEEIGGFLALNDNKQINLNEVSKEINKNKGYSKTNFFYLEKIIELCLSNNIRPILIRLPVYNKSLYYENETLFVDTVKTFSEKVKFIDLSNFKLNQSYFYDLIHLNKNGSIIISKYFKDIIKNIVVEK